MEMYVDEEIIQELKTEYGIEYVEGMKITPKIRDAIGQIWELRMAILGTLSYGDPNSSPAGELEEY